MFSLAIIYQLFILDTDGAECQVAAFSNISHGETVWVEGLAPGIDFCNHDLEAVATWEVDGTGLITGIPVSMYLLCAGTKSFKGGKEITISYGNKGNEELLYLYGFVINDNPDDYLMINYPVEAIQDVTFSEQKAQLLEAQKKEKKIQMLSVWSLVSVGVVRGRCLLMQIDLFFLKIS